MLSSIAGRRSRVMDDRRSLSVRVIDETSAFDGMRVAWNEVAAQMQPSSPMLSWEWARLWWEYFHGHNRLMILVFERGRQILGIAPFQERRIGIGSLGFRLLKPIGWEDYGNQGLTEHLELLFPPEHRSALMAELARWLKTNRISSVWLPSIDADETLPAWLGARVVEQCAHVPFHHRSLPSDYLAFVQGLNKSMRSNARYYAKLLIRHGHSFELQVGESPEDVSRLMPELIRLHKTRAYATHVSRIQHWDHFYRPDRTDFIRELAPTLAARGEFRVGLLKVDGEVVAGQTWFERGGTIFLYYSGFEPEWAKYGVQLVTTLEVLKRGIARGVRRVEFLRGGGQLKERWDTEVRVLRHTRCASSPALGHAIRAVAGSSRRQRDGQ